MTSEEWRRVPGHPDYEVSSCGRIRSYKQRPDNPRILCPGEDDNGYVRTHLDGVHFYVHQVVALAWLGPCPDGAEVCHRNHKRSDNRPENLKYGTRLENLTERPFDKKAAKCRRNHDWTPENTYIVPSTGSRVCRKCLKLRRKSDGDRCPHCGQLMPGPAQA